MSILEECSDAIVDSLLIVLSVVDNQGIICFC